MQIGALEKFRLVSILYLCVHLRPNDLISEIGLPKG